MYKGLWLTHTVVITFIEPFCLVSLSFIDALTDLKSSLDNAVMVHLFVKNMDDFARVNPIYKKFFTVNPPARYLFFFSNSTHILKRLFLYSKFLRPNVKTQILLNVFPSHFIQYKKENITIY